MFCSGLQPAQHAPYQLEQGRPVGFVECIGADIGSRIQQEMSTAVRQCLSIGLNGSDELEEPGIAPRGKSQVNPNQAIAVQPESRSTGR
jgi:hypothetical protein